jgi:hypothetical protein
VRRRSSEEDQISRESSTARGETEPVAEYEFKAFSARVQNQATHRRIVSRAGLDPLDSALLTFTAPHCSSLLITAPHWSSLVLIGPHWSSLLTAPHCPSLPLTALHCPPLPLTAPHCPSSLLTAPHGSGQSHTCTASLIFLSTRVC